MIILSIDIMGGKVVQLRRGRELLLTDDRDAADLAARFGRCGPVAVVDLDAALGRGENREMISACCRVARCRVGGGIRTAEALRDWIRRGADKVVVGTMATPEFLRAFPREWLVVALDARADEVVVQGWTKGTGRCVLDQARALEPYCGEFLYTQVEREGMLAGCDLVTAAALRQAVDVPVTVAGGITTVAEIRRLEDLGCNSQLGRALYEGCLDPYTTWTRLIRFAEDGLVPTIVQDDLTDDVLMLAYSSAESLHRALATGQGWYYSRSRRKLWRKGESSGNTQRLMTAAWDCDRDAVLFRVVQSGPVCHRRLPTCFGDRRPDVLRQLEDTLEARRRGADRGSYTCRLLDDAALVASKLREEIEEVIEARAPADIVWESADVLYHLLVRMRADGIMLDDACAELRSRFKTSRDAAGGVRASG